MSSESSAQLQNGEVSRHHFASEAASYARQSQVLSHRRLELLATFDAYADAFALIRTQWTPRVPFPPDAPDPRTNDAHWTAYRLDTYGRQAIGVTLGVSPQAQAFRTGVLGQFEIHVNEARVKARQDPEMDVDRAFGVTPVHEGISMRPYWRAHAINQALYHRNVERMAYTVRAVIESRLLLERLCETWQPLPKATLTPATVATWVANQAQDYRRDPKWREERAALLHRGETQRKAEEIHRYDQGQSAYDQQPAFASSSHHYVKPPYQHLQTEARLPLIAQGTSPAFWYGEHPQAEALRQREREEAATQAPSAPIAPAAIQEPPSLLRRIFRR